MNTQVSVDADLLAQAMQKMRIQDSQVLIEQFLRSIVQSHDSLDIHSAFGLVKTTRTTALDQIELPIGEQSVQSIERKATPLTIKQAQQFVVQAIPSNHNLAEELIAERRTEAKYE